VARLKEFGDEIRRRFGKPIAAGHGEGNTLILDLQEPTPLNHAVLMEDIRQGERVRAYVLEGLSGGTWITLAEGTCIGHKHIEQFNDVAVTKVRLRITQAIAEPIIRSLSLFHIE